MCLFQIGHPYPQLYRILNYLYLILCVNEKQSYPFCVWMKNDSHPPAEQVMDVKGCWLCQALAHYVCE
jgi:hypothetical protein